MRLVFRHLPLWEIRGHESSRAAAALSEMAGEQGKFWPFVEAVHARSHQLDRPGYLELMSNLGFNSTNVEARLSDPQDAAVGRVLRDEELAERLGINQTPTFVLLVAGQQPISGNQRTLPRLLNSPVVQSKLAQAAQR
ncbi:MAG: DsbA family protein [Opitutaceae bacterium]|nr:DsbA family protein [Opitutaceae bacterium]